MNSAVLEQTSGPPVVIAIHDGVVTIAVGGQAVDINQRHWQTIDDTVHDLINDTPALGRIHRHRAGTVS